MIHPFWADRSQTMDDVRVEIAVEPFDNGQTRLSPLYRVVSSPLHWFILTLAIEDKMYAIGKVENGDTLDDIVALTSDDVAAATRAAVSYREDLLVEFREELYFHASLLQRLLQVIP